MTTEYQPTIVDLFCGCGGFGLGAELAGFKTLAAIDVDSTLQSAYKLNFPDTNVINADLTTIDGERWNSILQGQTVDGVIGGPPCQAFSRQGKRNIEDPRRELLTEYFNQINILSPRFFVMENVEGLMDEVNRPHLDEALSLVSDRYTIIGPFIADASEWGAATKRKRVFVIGFDADRMPNLTSADFEAPQTQTTVWEAIHDLPSPIPQTKLRDDFGWASYRSSPLSAYAQQMRTLPEHNLGTELGRRMLLDDQSSGHFDTVHTEAVKNRYSNLPQGETDKISRSKKLHWEGLCPTLKAGTGADKGSHQAVRPLHPVEGRVITVREAARLQGFPDWFCFHPTKWHSFRMIGNSVTPIVSKGLLERVYDKLM